jgi:pimeloyl-ACP methyl ester carboxylesterase
LQIVLEFTMKVLPIIAHIFSFLGPAISASSAVNNPSLTSVDFQWPSQWVRSGDASLRVLVQGNGPAVVVVPSYGRDGGLDFNFVSERLVEEGFKVLRPQPRGTFGSRPIANLTLDILAADIASVIDTLAGGRAIVFGHAFGTFVTKRVALDYPDKVPSIIVAAPGAQKIPAKIASQPLIAGNTTLPLEQRLKSHELAFFAPGHDARVWLQGWYLDTLVMEHEAIVTQGDLTLFWAGGNETQVLELIPEADPFQRKDTWNHTIELYPERATSRVIANASHALFPENPEGVFDAIVPWLLVQSRFL